LVVWCAVVALAWPSLGALPWVAAESLESAHHAAHDRLSEAAGELPSGTHRHRDGSEIPGSPTHPADHDCFQCQVLKHWSRCAPSAIALPQVAALRGSAVQPASFMEAQRTASIASLPPARAPPLHCA
jgi:hypothetical protein